MTKRSEAHQIALKKKKWDRAMLPVDHFWKATKKELKLQMEGMMYAKRPKDAVDRFEHAFFWWVKLGIILFAIKGVGLI